MADRVVTLAKKKILSTNNGDIRDSFLNNIEDMIGSEEDFESVIKYIDKAITKSEEIEGYVEYNYNMLSGEAIKFIAEHTDKVDSILELEKLELFTSHSGGGAIEIFSKAETLLLDGNNFEKLKNYIILVKGKSNSDQIFYLDHRVVNYIGDHVDSMDDILSLGDIVSFEDGNFRVFMINNLEKILSITKEKREAYVTVFKKIDSSPSQEIQRLKNQLLEQLLETENPVKAYERIESIFIKNNLPTVGKIYKVFSELYPSEKLDRMLESLRLSPTLRKAGDRRRSYTMSKDLLRVHIESGNWSLK